jgi:hypothetical protein
MNRIRLGLTALVGAFALAALTSASAFAVAPEFLPNPAKGTTFTGTSGAGELQIKGGGTIKCSSDKSTGEITGQKAIKATVTFEGCKAIGFAANTASDLPGVILTELTGELCEIEKAKKLVGAKLTLPSTVIIEVPTAKQKIEVKGSVIGEVKPVGVKQSTGELVFTQKEGVQKPTKCEGDETESILLAKEAEKAFKQAGEATTESLTFSKEIEVTSA